jgi:signal transduction histidine kinase
VKEKTKELAEKVAAIDIQLAHVQQANRELEQSGKMLVRRDLELSRANERLREVDTMKTDFVSVATHQMRTPLSGVRWTLSMIIKGDLGDLTPDQRTFLMKAYESNERMIALIDDLLFTDKIESGKLVITDESTHAPDLVENVITELQPIALNRNIKIQFNRPEGKPLPVRISAPHLRAVFQNLLENAIKYSNPGGVVLIEFEEKDGYLHISVADNGIGIPSDQQDRVFTRFYRAPNAVKMETDGSGLGLYIIKNILTKHHGRIWIETTENVGSKFHVELPTAAAHV